METGQGLVEYGLILGLMAVLIVTTFVMFDSIVGMGRDASGDMSTEAMGRRAAALSAGIY